MPDQPLFMQPTRGNAPLSAQLLKTPLCHVFGTVSVSVFNDVYRLQVLSIIFCNQELLWKSGCQVLITSSITLGPAGSLMPILGLTSRGEFNFFDFVGLTCNVLG